jgi:hypothetical protein
MPRATLSLWVNSDTNQLASGWQSSSQAQPPVFKQGDTVGLELHWVRNANTQGLAMEEVEWTPSAGITLAIGRIEAPPTFGTFTLAYAGDETPALQFDAASNDVEDALNALPSIVAVGGVTASKQGNSYRIVFNDAGVLAATLNYEENDLFPASSIGVTLARAGTASVRAIYQVAIKQSPVAYTETFVDQESATPTISVIKTSAFAGDTKIWRLSVYPYPKDGTMVIGWTDNGVTKTTQTFLSTITGTELQEVMNLVDPDEEYWTVKKVGIYSWDFSTSATTIASPTVNGAGLLSFSAKYCELSLNTVEVENLLNGTARANAFLEIETLIDGVRQTLLQTGIVFVNDIIDEADYTIVSRSEVMPVDSVVRHDTAQTLTTGQKTQARQNISAVGDSDIVALQATIDAIDNRLSSSEGVMLTTDEYAAITGATTPTGANPFVTGTALSTELTGYSQTGHTHIIGDVVGLETALNGKASSTHTHTTTDIINFTEGVNAIVSPAVAGKADLVHTHSIADVTGLQTNLNSLSTAIDDKANINHGHPQSGITGLVSDLGLITTNIGFLQTEVASLQLVAPTQDEKDAITSSEAPTALNPFVTDSAMVGFRDSTICEVNQTVGSNLSGHGTIETHYPEEIQVTIQGVVYAIPARIV